MEDTRATSTSIGEAFRLRDWFVQPTLNRISRPASDVHIEPKHMDLLVYLAKHAGRIQSKEQILEAVWPEQYVAESALTRAIAELRRALDDDARSPTYIETIPKRGYRLIADVDAAVPQSKKPWRLGWWQAVSAGLVLAFLVAWQLTRVQDQAPSNGPFPAYRQRQVTTSTAFDIYPSFSPDGTSLVYGSDRTGSFELVVRQLTPGGREIALTNDGQNNLQPAWSPDGAWIAYHSIGRGGIWLIPSMGGQTRQLSEFGSNPTWSPDGSMIAFESYGPWLLNLGASTVPLPGTIWVLEIREGATPRQVTWESKPRRGHGMPTFAPDGDHIFFSNRIDLWSVSLSDLSLRSYPQPGSALDPVVSHDGDTVYYMASIQGDFWLCSLRLDIDEAKQQTLFNIPARHLRLSPDGKRFAMSLYDSKSNLWSVPLDPATDQPIGPPTRLTEETNQRNTLPSYSPDGEIIVFNRFLRGAKGSIWTISPDGTDQREIYSQPGVNVRFPQWTQDGRSLYVQSAGSFHLLNLETRRLERYAAPDGMDWLQWGLSPDGKRVAFSREIDAVTNIWVVDAEGGDEKQITFDPEYASYPTWSPDGEWIAIELSREGHTFLAIVPSSGGKIKQLTIEPEHSWSWGWSSDRSKIAFAGSRSGVWNIWWVALSEDSTQQLTEHEGNRGTFVRYPTWSPKGDRIVYERSESTADIWFLDLIDGSETGLDR